MTKDEATSTGITIPIELILDPKKYAEDVKNAPKRHLETIENLPENVKQKVAALKAWAEEHGLTLGLSGEGEDVTVQIIVPEGMKDSEMPFDGGEFGVVALSDEGEAALRKQLGLPEEGALTVIMGANGEAEIVYGEGDAGTMAANGLRLLPAAGVALPEVTAAAIACAASVVCGATVVIGTVVIAGVTYAVTTDDKPKTQANPNGGSVAAAGDPGLEPGEDPENSKNDIKFPEDDSQVRHIFRDAEGHFSEDTPTNRQTLINTASNSDNFLGVDRHGTQWYGKIQSDGSQVWVQVRNGVIRNGGVNETPNTWNPTTGLSGPKL